MRNLPHLVVSISGHGFGHVAQVAPVQNAFYQLMPQLRITVRSAVLPSHLRSRIHAPFIHLPSEGDIGMAMSSALDVSVEDSRAAYQNFHADWDKRVKEEARTLRELRADFVLSNVGYLPLAGARLAGIPNAALCSLNWADIYRHYCGDDAIAAQIHDCYANADAFLRAAPGMEMGHLANLIPIAPIAAIGTNRRGELNDRLNLASGEKLVLISMGGVVGGLPTQCWPRIGGARWLVQESWQASYQDAIVIESLQMSFSDLLASSDTLICKPGYGSFVEATCSGVSVLYVNRPDWPESIALTEWLQQHNICREISRSVFEQGNIADELDEIWNTPRTQPVVPEGAGQAAAWLAKKMVNHQAGMQPK
jgi:hypothetical protein